MNNKISAEPKAKGNALRSPSLAGMFYPEKKEELNSLLTQFFNDTVTSVTNPKGILVPHAGYIYSGRCAAVSYSKISPDFNGTFVIIAPSHQGFDTCVSDLIWETPIGSVNADEKFIEALDIPLNNNAVCERENSIEVQIPFIKHRFPKASIVPILIGDQSYSGAKYAADAVISAIKRTGITPVIIASGDGSHYVPRKKAETDDLIVLAALKNLDTKKFYDALIKIQPSMCGYGCICAMAEICKYLGAKESRVLTYQTSGDATGDYSEVVGYISMEVV
ncbi:MAG: AmmeMemoRadiSam system protein B [Methanocorpusculum sp.]|nr:AmmeMemoRadiSam system protein B [Methanocorpusculum sp.]